MSKRTHPEISETRAQLELLRQNLEMAEAPRITLPDAIGDFVDGVLKLIPEIDRGLLSGELYERRRTYCDRAEHDERIKEVKEKLRGITITAKGEQEYRRVADVAERLLSSYGIAPGQDLWYAVVQVCAFLRATLDALKETERWPDS